MSESGNGTHGSYRDKEKERLEREQEISRREHEVSRREHEVSLHPFLVELRDYLVTNIKEIRNGQAVIHQDQTIITSEQATIKQSYQDLGSAIGSELQKISSSLNELKTEMEILKQLTADIREQANVQPNKAKIVTQTNTPTSAPQQTTSSSTSYFPSFFRSSTPSPPPPPRVLVIRTYRQVENITTYLNEEARKIQANIQFVDYFITPSIKLNYSAKEFKACVFAFFCGTVRWVEALNGSWKDQCKKLTDDFAVFKLLCLQESYTNKNAPTLGRAKDLAFDPPVPLVYYNEKINAESSEVISKFINSLVQELKNLQ